MGARGALDVALGPAAPGAGRARRTVLRAISHRAPLQLGRLLYPDTGCPEMAFLYVAMLSGGLAQGDRLAVGVALEPGARAHVTTLAATKIYRMERDGAEQTVRLSAGPGAVLEWWPDPLIPFRGARFRQDVRLSVDPAATVLYGDLLLPGRTARGERHDYAAYASQVVATRPDGRLLFVDGQALAPPPPGADRFSTTLPPGLDVVGTVYVLAPPTALDLLAPALAAAVAEAASAGALAGVSRLPAEAGFSLRLLAPDGPAGRRAMRAAWSAARHVLLGAGPPDERKL
jgi:urease accessory protein